VAWIKRGVYIKDNNNNNNNNKTQIKKIKEIYQLDCIGHELFRVTK